MAKFEAVIPIRNEKGLTPAGKTVELSGEEARRFLTRGYVKEPSKSGASTQGKAGDAAEE